MPFNPSLPVDGSKIVAVELRNQFGGLKDLIDGKATPEDVSNAINTQTAGPCGQLDYLDLQPSDPPTQADLVAVIKQLNDFLALTRRE
jgi:hypothetical protein